MAVETVLDNSGCFKTPIAIMGAGALGSLYGAMLAETGVDTVLIRRSKDHLKAIKTGGLRLSGVRGERTIKVKTTTDPSTLGPVDVVLFTVKSFHTEQAANDCLPMVGPDTTVLSLQNGVDHIERIGNILGSEKVLGGLSTHNAVFMEPGLIYHSMDGSTTIGEPDGTMTDRVRRISRVLNHAGIKTEISGNILGALWTKLLICVSAITLNAVVDLPGAEMLRVPELKELITRAAQEVIRVAGAAGISLSMDDPISWLLDVERAHETGKSSMRQDLEKGAKTEIDAFSGFVVGKGKEFGIPTPYNEALVGIIKGLERKGRR